MKKTLSIAIVLAFGAISVLLFLKSDSLKNIFQKRISEKLSALPYDMACKLEELSLFPLELRFSTMKAGRKGAPLVLLNHCRMSGFLALVTGKVPRICVECESGEILFGNFSKRYESGPQSILNASKAGGFTNAILNLVIHHFRFLSGSEVGAFVFRGKWERNRFHAFCQGPGQGKDRPFFEVRGNVEESKAELNFRHIDLKDLIGLFFSEEKKLPKGKAGGSARLSVSDKGAIDITADIDISHLLFSHKLIDAKPLMCPLTRVKGRAVIDIDEKCLSLTDAGISLKGIDLDVRGEARGKQYNVSFSTERLGLNDFVLLLDDPMFDDFQMKGFIQANLSIEGDLKGEQAISKIELKGAIEDVKQLSRRLQYLRGDFVYQFHDNRGKHFEHAIGQGSWDYVSLNRLPEYIYSSVVLAEDGAFFGHKGIDFREIEAALKEYIEISRMRGGSTITQQLAKNLFLTKDKNIMRKLKEMVLAIELDASLSKQRILEIYLNIIEWGPGILGIGHAAGHYFGKRASMLSPLEGAYLASIIPNPKRFYVHYQKGIVNPNWRERVNQILDLMHQKGYISHEQFKRALDEHIVFSKN